MCNDMVYYYGFTLMIENEQSSRGWPIADHRELSDTQCSADVCTFSQSAYRSLISTNGETQSLQEWPLLFGTLEDMGYHLSQTPPHTIKGGGRVISVYNLGLYTGKTLWAKSLVSPFNWSSTGSTAHTAISLTTVWTYKGTNKTDLQPVLALSNCHSVPVNMESNLKAGRFYDCCSILLSSDYHVQTSQLVLSKQPMGEARFA